MAEREEKSPRPEPMAKRIHLEGPGKTVIVSTPPCVTFLKPGFRLLALFHVCVIWWGSLMWKWGIAKSFDVVSDSTYFTIGTCQ